MRETLEEDKGHSGEVARADRVGAASSGDVRTVWVPLPPVTLLVFLHGVGRGRVPRTNGHFLPAFRQKGEAKSSSRVCGGVALLRPMSWPCSSGVTTPAFLPRLEPRATVC